MAGLRRGPKTTSSRSLGSFVDVQSASSSDFEPVDLEDMESADESDTKGSTATQQGKQYNFKARSRLQTLPAANLLFCDFKVRIVPRSFDVIMLCSGFREEYYATSWCCESPPSSS